MRMRYINLHFSYSPLLTYFSLKHVPTGSQSVRNVSQSLSRLLVREADNRYRVHSDLPALRRSSSDLFLTSTR